MPRRGKRGPPLSYNDKYRQIKESKFTVDIPRPDTPSAKALVTRYHRILFGGRKKDGSYTRGISSKFSPTKSKYADDIKELWKVKGASRIKNAYYPSQFGHVSKVTKNFIYFTSKAGTFKILNVNPKELALASRAEREQMLKPLVGKRVQLMIGNSIQGIVFDDIEDVFDAYDLAEDTYSDIAPVYFIS